MAKMDNSDCPTNQTQDNALVDVLSALCRQRLMVFITTGVLIIAIVFYVLLSPSVYRVRTIIEAPELQGRQIQAVVVTKAIIEASYAHETRPDSDQLPAATDLTVRTVSNAVRIEVDVMESGVDVAKGWLDAINQSILADWTAETRRWESLYGRLLQEHEATQEQVSAVLELLLGAGQSGSQTEQFQAAVQRLTAYLDQLDKNALEIQNNLNKLQDKMVLVRPTISGTVSRTKRAIPVFVFIVGMTAIFFFAVGRDFWRRHRNAILAGR